MQSAQILNHIQIQQKIVRIAHEVAEFNYDLDKICIIGIAEGGYKLAGLIVEELINILSIEIRLGKLSMDKTDVIKGSIALDIPIEKLDACSVVLVDDVLESGRTLTYAAKHLLNRPLKKLATVVLVDRMHPKFPIRADFVGLTLSTTLKNHIALKDEDGQLSVHLF
ncbi:MAG: phosphoribosyltransferase family protein [Luteibaculum sp.]